MERPPWRLSTAGVRAVLIEAIARARRQGSIRVLGDLAETPGFRRTLRSRIASWSRMGLDPQSHSPTDAGTVEVAEWAIFRIYQSLLAELGAVDSDGFVREAALELQRNELKSWDWSRFEHVVIIDPPVGDSAIAMAIKSFHHHAARMDVTLPFDPTRPEAFASRAPLRGHLLQLGFVERGIKLESNVDEPIAALNLLLFHEEPDLPITITGKAGIRFLGASRGDALARLVAQRVKTILSSPGTRPDDLAIVVPMWDDQARVLQDLLRSWSIPVYAEDGTGPISADPAVTALLMAIRLPVDGWEVARLTRFLRHGQLHPDWPEAVSNFALPETAAIVRDTRVFRGAEAIQEALDRLQQGAETADPVTESARKRSERLRRSRSIINRLIRVLDPLNRPAPWAIHVKRLEALKDELRIGHDHPSSNVAIDALLDALEEHDVVLDALRRSEEPIPWDAFVPEVQAIARELTRPAEPVRPGSVRLTTPEAIRGTCFPHVLLVNLGEGTFPDRDAIENDPTLLDDEPSTGVTAMSREMFRFLELIGTARQTLTFAHATTDEAGLELLRAGFLEEVRALFDVDVLSRITEERRRLDVLPDANPAGTPRDLRVLAIAQACQSQSTEILRRLIRDPDQRTILARTAVALRVAAQRSRSYRSFGRYEGHLRDRLALERVIRSFSGRSYAFSPSQLESLSYCPFQFFLRYVLRLQPIQDRSELDDDHAIRGSLVHRALEQLHLLSRDAESPLDLSQAETVVEPLIKQIDQLLEAAPPASNRIEAGLRRIERQRLHQLAVRYARQHEAYRQSSLGRAVTPHAFEAKFGRFESDLPPLEILGETTSIRVQGSIDRIDVVQQEDGLLFRVIDYKTGHAPSEAQLRGGLALQLPLYALAAERILLADEQARPLDVGYWALRKEGYRALTRMIALEEDKQIPSETWDSLRDAIERFVLDLVSSMYAGHFVVAPRTEDCTRNCDYRTVCRIKQVRQSAKRWAQAPFFEIES